MKKIAIASCTLAVMALGQSGRITGVVTDDTGAPVGGAIVSAALRTGATPGTRGPGGLPSFMPFPPKAPTSGDGTFEIDALPAGTYALCVDKLGSALLNPCLWTSQPVLATLTAGGSAQGVSVVAPKGVFLTIRVLDPKKSLIRNPISDDVHIGTYHGNSPFIPALVSGWDMKGKTMSLAVLPGQPVNLTVSSSAYALADANGISLGSGVAQIAVPAAVLASATSTLSPTPAVTIQVTGKN